MMVPLSRDGFLTLLRRGQHNWSDKDRRRLVHHLNWFEGEPHTDPDVVTDPCDRADLIDIFILNEVAWDVTENIPGWNDFCQRHPHWPPFLEEHCSSCTGRHAKIAEVMVVELPKAKATLRGMLAQITATDPTRGADLIERYGADIADPEDTGE